MIYFACIPFVGNTRLNFFDNDMKPSKCPTQKKKENKHEPYWPDGVQFESLQPALFGHIYKGKWVNRSLAETIYRTKSRTTKLLRVSTSKCTLYLYFSSAS